MGDRILISAGVETQHVWRHVDNCIETNFNYYGVRECVSAFVRVSALDVHLPISSLHVPCCVHPAAHFEGREAICAAMLLSL
jgi:hypothetical protein